MNERIKELIEEAGGYGLPDRDGDRTPALVGKSVEKFAELIVKECAKIADDGCGSACFGLGINGQMLKEHFGVEE